ncbi:YicC/YloC family endoribonuclease [Elioraea tepidiphila]|uniref:YicC/YloC family endoribonuclease n=1 Tax=Elioraea tepidiphila TaxID=457934 RepID=UPI0004774583|nr:YicC/YloC family endoribonuclease [Elioraea tepidiphila]
MPAPSPHLASMTGFARHRGEGHGIAWVWEVKSVNGRGLDLRFRLPNGLDAIEPALREVAQKHLRRGNVSATLTVRRDESAARPTLDPAALDAALALIAEVRGRIPDAPAPSAEAVLALPGVLRAPAAEEDDEAVEEARRGAIAASFRAAIEALAEARREEGARIGAVLAAKLDEIEALVITAEADAATQPAALRDKLTAALRSLLDQVPQLPEERLAQEVALLAARADVREEIDRLHAHLAQARALLAEGALVGRRLDFLTQEFNREANTLCSKAAAPSLTATGLALKAAIEQFREQVQNLE